MACAKLIMIQDIVPDMKFMPTKFELKITLDFEDMINDVIISENYKMAPR